MKPKEQLVLLIVDDSSTMRRVLRGCLLRYGAAEANLAEASQGLEALDRLKARPFDGVLADWNMPECDGLELLARMRQLPGYERTPFIMITSESGREDVIQAIRAGVTDYVAKPIDPAALSKKLAAIFGV
jgi:two-component system, chemotaxis family, chemotaxis protein CheY